MPNDIALRDVKKRIGVLRSTELKEGSTHMATR